MKVVMEEKERYVKYDPDNDDIITRIIYDTIEKKPIIVTADRCIDLLNQQDKENQQLKALLKATEVTDIHNELADLQINNEWLESENQQLKQSQKQLAISELEKIYNLFEPYENSQKDTILCANNGISFIDYLENQIKSLKGEE